MDYEGLYVVDFNLSCSLYFVLKDIIDFRVSEERMDYNDIEVFNSY